MNSKFFKLTVAILLTIICAACACHPSSCHPSNVITDTKSTKVTKLFTLPNQQFTQIAVDGDMSLDIISDSRMDKSRIRITKRYFDEVLTLGVSDNTLHIAKNPSLRYFGPKNNTVKLYVHNLDKVIMNGHGKVTINNLRSEPLTIEDHGSGTIHVMGNVKLNKIIQTGSGRIDVAWIDNKKLAIESSGTGKVHLAGMTNNLFARLSGKAYLDTRFLRAKNVWIDSKDNSEAKIIALNSIEAFAADKANIQYYKRPKHFDRNILDRANILYMGDYR